MMSLTEFLITTAPTPTSAPPPAAPAAQKGPLPPVDWDTFDHNNWERLWLSGERVNAPLPPPPETEPLPVIELTDDPDYTLPVLNEAQRIHQAQQRLASEYAARQAAEQIGMAV